MRIVLVLFLAALLAIASHVDARYVSHSSSSSDDDSFLSSVVKQLKVPVEDVAIIKSKSLISRQLTHLEEKRSFVDLLPYVGSFIFRGVVRRVKKHNFLKTLLNFKRTQSVWNVVSTSRKSFA